MRASLRCVLLMVAVLVLMVVVSDGAALQSKRQLVKGIGGLIDTIRQRIAERDAYKGAAPAANCDISNTKWRSVKSGAYSTVGLNTVINAGYIQFANCFQSIVEGEPASSSGLGSKTAPVWFVFAPYASRVVGKGEYAIETSLKAADDLFRLPSPSLWDVVKHIVFPIGALVMDGVDITDRVKSFIQSMLSALYVGSKSGNMGVMNDKAIMAVTMARALKLITGYSSNPVSGAKALGRTLLNALADGNRRIYVDVGGAGQMYLEARGTYLKGRKATAADIEPLIKAFCGPYGTDFDQVKKAHDWAKSKLSERPAPFRFDGVAELSLGGSVNGKALMGAALWLYEEAGQDPSIRDSAIYIANNFFAYREQHDAVQLAFTPGSVLKDEVDRKELFQMMTVTLHLLFRSGSSWRFYEDYCVPKSVNILGKNWGLFEDRWEPIISAFDLGYKNLNFLWPLPPADATKE